MSDLKDFYTVIAGAADALNHQPPATIRRRGTRRRRLRHGVLGAVAVMVVAATAGVVALGAAPGGTTTPAATGTPVPSPTTRSALAAPRLVGEGIPYGSAGSAGSAGSPQDGATAVAGDRGYAVWRTADGTVLLGGVDLRTGRQIWAPRTVTTGADAQAIAIAGDVLLVSIHTTAAHTFGFDPVTGNQLWHVAGDGFSTASALVVTTPGAITGYSLHSGRQMWRSTVSWFDVRPMASAADGALVHIDPQISVQGPYPDFQWQAFDTVTGTPRGPRAKLGQRQELLHSAGAVFVAAHDAATGTNVISMIRDGAVVPIHTEPPGIINRYMTACWPQRVCLMEVTAPNTGTLTAFDATTGHMAWQSPAHVLGLMTYTGELITSIIQGRNGTNARLAVYDGAGHEINAGAPAGPHVDVVGTGPDILTLSGTGSARAAATRVQGIGVDGALTDLGQITAAAPTCTATATRLICLGDTAVTVWNIRTS
jgi:outer membrane protein assembly factor BamB